MPAPCFLAPSALAPRTRRGPLSRAPRMCAGPRAPPDFTPPAPRLAYVRGDAAARIARGALAGALRAAAGAAVSGYRVRVEDGRVVEWSATLPEGRPARPLVLYAYPACPYCRKVFEAMSMLDLDVMVKPCPRGGKVYREYVKEAYGKAQFPYLEDPNTGFGGYESADILKYLFQTYGGLNAAVPLVLGSAGTFTAGLASVASGRRGAQRVESVVTAPRPLEVWGYEASPFCKVVFERLVELEIPYLLHTTPRGSPTRAALKERIGRFQVPYLIDDNTGIAMFESAEIVDYLDAVYGAGAEGAKEAPTQDEIAAANAVTVDAQIGIPASAAPDKVLDPEPSTGQDASLEEYCEASPDADECRTYED